jgi:hypothetical protein
MVKKLKNLGKNIEKAIDIMHEYTDQENFGDYEQGWFDCLVTVSVIIDEYLRIDEIKNDNEIKRLVSELKENINSELKKMNK